MLLPWRRIIISAACITAILSDTKDGLLYKKRRTFFGCVWFPLSCCFLSLSRWEGEKKKQTKKNAIKITNKTRWTKHNCTRRRKWRLLWCSAIRRVIITFYVASTRKHTPLKWTFAQYIHCPSPLPFILHIFFFKLKRILLRYVVFFNCVSRPSCVS